MSQAGMRVLLRFQSISRGCQQNKPMSISLTRRKLRRSYRLCCILQPSQKLIKKGSRGLYVRNQPLATLQFPETFLNFGKLRRARRNSYSNGASLVVSRQGFLLLPDGSHPYLYASCTVPLFHRTQAVFMQRVEILSTTTRSKKIEVTGGFYSEEDMKSELGYSQTHGSISIGFEM